MKKTLLAPTRAPAKNGASLNVLLVSKISIKAEEARLTAIDRGMPADVGRWFELSGDCMTGQGHSGVIIRRLGGGGAFAGCDSRDGLFESGLAELLIASTDFTVFGTAARHAFVSSVLAELILLVGVTFSALMAGR